MYRNEIFVYHVLECIVYHTFLPVYCIILTTLQLLPNFKSDQLTVFLPVLYIFLAFQISPRKNTATKKVTTVCFVDR